MKTNSLSFASRFLAVPALVLGLASCDKQDQAAPQPDTAAASADARAAVQRTFSFTAVADRGINTGATFSGDLFVTLRPAGGNVPGAQSLRGYWLVNARRSSVSGALTPPGTGTINEGGFGELSFQVRNFVAAPFGGRLVQVDADVQPDGTYRGRFTILTPSTPASAGSGTIVLTPR